LLLAAGYSSFRGHVAAGSHDRSVVPEFANCGPAIGEVRLYPASHANATTIK
jgi:hypothetical protein